MRLRAALAGLALGGLAIPGQAAQESQACLDEVQRLVAAFPLDAEDKQAAAIAQAPGARKGAALSEDQRWATGDQIKQAQAAGERGDGQGCLEHLAGARTLLRQGGLGGAQPGMATGGGLQGASGARGSGSGTPRGTPAGVAGTGTITGRGGIGGGATGGGAGLSGGSMGGGGSSGGGGGSSGGG